ncbi:MAG: IlvD/Edd family dehydratase [Pseudomonadota bacterium]
MAERSNKGMDKGLTSYGDAGFSRFLRRAFIKGMGYSEDALSRPVIGIADTGSGYNACHGNMPDLIAAVTRGVQMAGGLAVPFPTISLHESFSHPTSMYLRNLMSMDTEEMIRAQPMDAVVLIGGCDKTVPAQLMGAASANVPAIQLVTGPMLTGSHRGGVVGACTDCRRFWAAFRADEVDETEIAEVNEQLVPGVGTCSVMGTASTMALIAEALGIALPGSACAPAVSAERRRIAEDTGRQAVRLAAEGVRPTDIMDRRAIENALRVLLAIGGSTNGIIHLTAIAGRLGIRIDLEAVDRMARETPVLVNLKPSGSHYMQDLEAAGGLVRILHEIKDLLHLDAPRVDGQTLGEVLEQSNPDWPQDVVRTRSNPIYPEGGLALLKGSLAPNGAIIKQSAASSELMIHEGRAVVFAGLEDLANRLDDPDLDVAADDILVLQNIGPKGAPGMPEAGLIPIPKKLARQGVKDMVRISDGRMSGTASGTIALHVSPESVGDGPLGLVRTGDRIRLDVPNRRLDLLVPEAELAARSADVPDHVTGTARGYRKLYLDEVLQAEDGVDFAFCQPPMTEIAPNS